MAGACMPACGPKESRRSAEARGARDVKRRHSCWAGKNIAVVEPRSGILARNLRGGRKEKGETMPQTVHSRRVMGDARTCGSSYVWGEGPARS